MTKKILEIQNKIENLNADIASHCGLLTEQESDNINFEKILEQLNDQRNELLIEERITGTDNKSKVTEIDKSIKATKAAIEKQKEREAFLKSVGKKLDDKNKLLVKLTDEHKAAIVEHLSDIVAGETVKRNEIYGQYAQKAKEIAAYESIMMRFRTGQGFYAPTENESHIAGLLQKAGGIFGDGSLSNAVETLKNEYSTQLTKQGINL